MKAKIFISLLITMFIALFNINAQRNDNELSEQQQYYAEIKELRKNCRNALKPYRYDGLNTTNFIYKEYAYIKEVEIATVMDEEYRLSFNSIAIKGDPITLRIYDKEKKFKSRILLYEKTDFSGSEFTVETTEMVEKLKKGKIELLKTKKFPVNYDEKQKKEIIDQETALIEKIRLKKIYIDYIIPPSESAYKTDPETNEQVRDFTKHAIIVAVGFNNL